MSSADALLARRSSGSRRASAAFAGSSEGKTLSVTAISGRAMAQLRLSGRAYSAHSRASMPSRGRADKLPIQYERSTLKHLGVDAVRWWPVFQDGEHVIDHHVRHPLAQLHHGAAKMGREHQIGHLEQGRRHLGLLLEHVEGGA